MNGAQDLGGMMGFGPIAPEADEPVFHHGWERRALALTLAAAACGEWSIDASRHARETLPPAEYLAKTYYEIWIAGLRKLLLAAGMVGAEELALGRAVGPARPVKSRLARGEVANALARGSRYDRPPQAPPLFAPGEPARAKVINPLGHTRLPRYARGKTGLVEAVRGCFVFPDSSARGAGEDPQWCYTLRFAARELWGADADSNGAVSIDAFEPYLERP
jgi:nitrile hydratase subunit beta